MRPSSALLCAAASCAATLSANAGAADEYPAAASQDIQEGELDNPAMLIRKDGKPVLSNIKGNWDELNLVRCGHSSLRRPPAPPPPLAAGHEPAVRWGRVWGYHSAAHCRAPTAQSDGISFFFQKLGAPEEQAIETAEHLAAEHGLYSAGDLKHAAAGCGEDLLEEADREQCAPTPPLPQSSPCGQ